jgi:organic radical activating enzyme
MIGNLVGFAKKKAVDLWVFLLVNYSIVRKIFFICRKRIRYIEFHLAEHCNLNCAGCDHFSPLAKPEYPDIVDVEKDLSRIAVLTKSKIIEIKFLGGEPLLNKDIGSFLALGRRYFPKTKLTIITNGILLSKQPDAFWECCKKNTVDIDITVYPIKIDKDIIDKKCMEYCLRRRYYEPKDNSMYHCVLNLEGGCDAQKSFYKCPHNFWTFFRNGKIYPCPIAANARHFIPFFDKSPRPNKNTKNINISDNDFIDMHRVKSLKEILKFLSRPIPFCKYCDIGKMTYNHAWGISKKDIHEWT